MQPAHAAPIEPEVRLLWPAHLSQTVSTTPLVLRLGVRMTKRGVPDQVVARVNGREVPVRHVETEKAGRKQPGLAPNADEQVILATVTIPPRDADLRVQVKQANQTSKPVHVQLWWNGEQGGATVLPKLYLLSIGISAYPGRQMGLVYPHKDASDLVSVMTPQQPEFYERIDARILLDGQATRADILQGMQWLADQTTDKDVAMLLLAGHGVAEADTGDFYFVPYDGDLSKAYAQTLISGEQIRKKLAAVAGKAVLFLDACHGGAVFPGQLSRGPEPVNHFIKELQDAAHRVVIFSATNSEQSAKESREWRNGAFTKAVVEGLSGMADARHTGRVTVNMLSLYVSERVRELTQSRQKAVAGSLAAGEDFPVSAGGTALPPSDSTTPSDPLVTATKIPPGPKQPMPRSRPAWRLAVGSAAIGAGLIGMGFGFSAVSVNGQVDPGGPTPGKLYDTINIGGGLLGAGAGLLTGGILCITWPEKRSQP